MTPADVETCTGAEKLVDLLNQKGLVKLLDVFLTRGTRPVTTEQLMEFTGLSQPTVSRATRTLAEKGIIEMTDDGKQRAFTLDKSHPATQGLRKAHMQLHANVTEIQAASDEYDTDSELHHEGSPFVELFRYPTNVKLLAALLEHPDAELQAAQVARAADVDPATVSNNIDLLCEIGVVTKRDYDWSTDPRYALNQGHAAVEGLLQACDDLTPADDSDQEQHDLLSQITATSESDAESITGGLPLEEIEELLAEMETDHSAIVDADDGVERSLRHQAIPGDRDDYADRYQLQVLAQVVGTTATTAPDTESMSTTRDDSGGRASSEGDDDRSFLQHRSGSSTVISV